MKSAPQSILATLLLVASAAAQDESAFAADAARMAKLPYVPGYTPPTEFTKSLTYEKLARIRIKRPHWLFNESAGNLQVEPWLAGSFNSKGVQLGILEKGVRKPVPFRADLFNFPADIPNPGDDSLSGFKGFCVHGSPRKGSPSYEQFTFGGASYFRGHAEGLNYGLSARGLILKKDGKEEFPMFESFLFEEPSEGSSVMVWHALLNSPSATGAFRFVSNPGNPHAMEIQADLFPREGLSWADLGIGLGGFSSMYWFSPADTKRSNDLRERVHDSEALAVSLGSGERIWRVLGNPKRVRESVFPARDLKGFGLIQRQRSFDAYEDETARYERRTSAWVVPLAGMDSGRVKLTEIPTRGEYDDNIVACYMPENVSNQPLRIAYRLLWCGDTPEDGLARVLQTRVGETPDKSSRLVTVDFDKRDLKPGVVPQVYLPEGLEQRFAYLKDLPGGTALRLHLGFSLRSQEPAKTGDIRVFLARDGKPVSETWVYPWDGSKIDSL